ncbi:AdeC/AdeK/OprM family multidrug efflux complex outer membrane factor [Chlorobaculum sp. MV4-Y]|uniref:AdeC/AdeK/OprM family multidrug efflux complex outer membrane factor n=1 Tax=Chlorobaculum sp. MV4-Y TaxID=2976335 RepID=UPI0021AF9C08|nr:AdeC/AdeK/OprM family multidrug efflux complex outer membrane factor [Chlorobaculum sp. MV4-Y]UWX58764.1 AdeC/AdeK/OprM family multidrug efflux complex outer membrane factor [Chlorobaculum sp. MV4-Y]
MSKSIARRGVVSLAFSALLLSGCAMGPDFVKPEAPAVKSYDRQPLPKPESGGQRFDEGVGPAACWWRSFGSSQLDAVVAQGLADNPGLQAAEASLKASRENLRAGAGIFYPQVSATFSQTRQAASPAASGGVSTGSILNLSTFSASVSYALDLFGGQRRSVEALGAQVDVQRAQTLGVYMTLTGNIVNTSIAIAAYRDELDEYEQLIAIEKDQLSIATKQYQAGIAPYSSVLALRSQIASLEAVVPPVRQKLSQAEHLLATLAGKTPAEWATPDLRLSGIVLPERVPLSLPSELVRQRPDILAAEAQLHAANAEIGVATAALFPSFTLTGSYGRTASQPHELSDPLNRFWSIGGNIAAPIFNGGSLRAKRRAAIASRNQTLALYRQAVLAAFAQVADLIRALEHDAEQAEAERQAVDSAKLSLDLIQANYKAGMVNYVQVILADIQYRQAKIGYLQARAQQMQDTAAMYVALGGGWQNDAGAKVKAGL